MLYIFLNPNKRLNSHICHILDKSQLDYEIHYPNSINDLDDIDLEHNSSNIALSVLSKVIFPEKFQFNLIQLSIFTQDLKIILVLVTILLY